MKILEQRLEKMEADIQHIKSGEADTGVLIFTVMFFVEHGDEQLGWACKRWVFRRPLSRYKT